MRQKERSANTIQKLIDTGYRLFAQKGFQTTSVSDIVRAAGYSKGAFYAHFASKEQFLIRVITERVQGYFYKLANVLEEDRPDMLPLFVEYSKQLAIQAYEESMSAILFELVVTTNRYPQVKNMLVDLFEEWRAGLATYFVVMKKKGLFRSELDPRVLANTAISVFHGFILQNYLDDRVHYLDFVESFILLLDPVESIDFR